MARTLAIFVLLIMTGCTSLQPIELSPEELQNKIVTDQVVAAGDRVKIVTRDGTQHQFKVVAIDNDTIAGKDISIPIGDIIALETREFSGGKTSLLVGGTMLWMLIILISLPAVVVL